MLCKTYKIVYRPLVNETILYYMNNVKQLIERLRDKCTAEQLNRTAILTSVQFDIWQIARKIYVILFDEQKQHDGYVLCRYRLESQSEHKCIGYIEKYFDDVELIGLTYRLSCLDEEISVDALYDTIQSVEHEKFMIIDKLHENMTVAKVKAL